jgi:hypothetical protein
MTSRRSVSSAGCAVSCRGIASSSSRERYSERQDQPVRLREGQGAFGGLVRRVLVAELTIGEPGQQISLDDTGVTDDGRNRRRAIKDTLQVAETLGQSSPAEAVTPRALPTSPELARPPSRPSSGARAWPAPPSASLRTYRPAGQPTRNSARASQLRLRASAAHPAACRAAIQLLVALCEAIETSSSRFRPSAKASMATRLAMNWASACARGEASIGDRHITSGMSPGGHLLKTASTLTG